MKISVLMFVTLILGAVVTAHPQANAEATVISEVKAFYDVYAEDLRLHRREALGARYDGRGSYFLGNGAKAFESAEETRRYYLKNWTGPKSFNWKNMEFEVITPQAVVVLARFEWATEKEPKPVSCSYSGLLLKKSGQWFIRMEDESCPPAK
jgi:hypothetical protein